MISNTPLSFVVGARPTRDLRAPRYKGTVPKLHHFRCLEEMTATMNSIFPNIELSLADFRDLGGADLVERCEPYFQWQRSRREAGTWVYDKTLESAPLPTGESLDGCGRKFRGANYCSQDYLSLASDETIKSAALEALARFGVHSAGSSALLGNTSLSRTLEHELSEFVDYEHILLFPTGWAAGYGIVKGLARSDDWIVMDALSHACLQEGARSATSNVVVRPPSRQRSAEKAARTHPREPSRKLHFGDHRNAVLDELRHCGSPCISGRLP